MVANGKVYVASYKQLAIFGLKPKLPRPVGEPLVGEQEVTLFAPTPPPLPQGVGSEVYGTIQLVEGSKLTLKTRTATVEVDASAALQNHLSVPLFAGGTVKVLGNYDANRVLHAEIVQRAKESPDMWLEDR
jgi:hypothetical protein